MVATTFAETTLKKYKESRNSQNELEKLVIVNYIAGIGEGLVWANTELESRKDKPLFCQPKKLALTDENYIQILNDEIKRFEEAKTDESERKKVFDSMPIGLFLLKGLIRTFPCN